MIDALLAARRVATNRIIVTELLIGAKNSQEYEELKSELAVLPHLTLTEDIWAESARLGFALRRKGISIPLPDLVIAGCAIVRRCELLFHDQDFALIAKHAPLKIYQHNGQIRR